VGSGAPDETRDDDRDNPEPHDHDDKNEQGEVVAKHEPELILTKGLPGLVPGTTAGGAPSGHHPMSRQPSGTQILQLPEGTWMMRPGNRPSGLSWRNWRECRRKRQTVHMYCPSTGIGSPGWKRSPMRTRRPGSGRGAASPGCHVPSSTLGRGGTVTRWPISIESLTASSSDWRPSAGACGTWGVARTVPNGRGP